jgi:hypothetical protein
VIPDNTADGMQRARDVPAESSTRSLSSSNLPLSFGTCAILILADRSVNTGASDLPYHVVKQESAHYGSILVEDYRRSSGRANRTAAGQPAAAQSLSPASVASATRCIAS